MAPTGALPGFGGGWLDAALLLAERGARIVLGARRSDRLEALATRIANVGGEATYAQADVRRRGDLAGALHTVTRAELASEGYGPVIEAITLLLHACKEAGAMRPDVDAEEVLLLVGFLWRIDLDTDWEARSRHMLDIVMDGLRRQPNAEL
jgi:NAD(P)-dependent dehydrogenase (short-subunit alcohol dehydrogenase family)